MSLSRHPHHGQYRIACASGFILGRPVPLPPLNPRLDLPYEGDKRRTPAFAEQMRRIMKANWEKRRERV